MSLSSAFVAGTDRPQESLTQGRYGRVHARLATAGITLDGPAPWDPQIRHTRALSRVLRLGTLGAGESYVDGDWECSALDELTSRLLTNNTDRALCAWPIATRLQETAARLVNAQSRARAKSDVASHYDLGEDLYAAMLGSTMAYSCGYWKDANTLDAAQIAKYALICHKLQLRPGMTVLEVGCGWGGFARYAAECCGVSVVGITLSEAQATYARQHTTGLPVDVRVQDYRDIVGEFDRIVSIGMFEHVGPANYRTFFSAMADALSRDGLFLLHTIGGSHSAHVTDPWLDRYIFPGTVLPSAAQITHACEDQFVIEDWHNFGADYDRTLMAWHERVEQAWPTLALNYSESFHRRWRYYLLTCAGTFRARRNQLWQIVLSRTGVRGGYRRVSE